MARLDNSGDFNANSNKLDGAGQPLGTELKQKMYDSGQAARQKLGEKAEVLTEKAVNLGEQQKSIGAQQLAGVASAVHTAAGELAQQMPQAANLVHAAADKIDSAAAALRDRRVDELLSDIGDIARERPWLVFGGAVLAGFALTRFVKSSANGTDQRLTSEAMKPQAPATNRPPHFVPKDDAIDSYEGTA